MASKKLHGRAFFESLGSPKFVVAPMVDQSEFAWRMLTRSFFPAEMRTTVLAYSPMFHAKLFVDSSKYRAQHFEPLKQPLILPTPADVDHQKVFSSEDLHLDGHPQIDRPLFVQFCANDPDVFLQAAKLVQPFCDAVDLNLGCPQGIARRGNYGAFLQEDWDTIHKLISRLHRELDVPVTAKFRIQETKERTLEYAKMILSAGASIITVHGRQRHQKGHNTGLADWTVLRYLREELPSETVIFANGNVLQHGDLQECLDATGADGVMSAEGNLYDPSIFAQPPAVGDEGYEYWRGRNGNGGYRADAVLRRYLDIIHRHVLGQEPPERQPLFLATEAEPSPSASVSIRQEPDSDSDGPPPMKKQKRVEDATKQPKRGKPEKCQNPNLTAMQPHCFHILRALVAVDHGVRDALARCKAGDIDAFENVLTLTEKAIKQGLLEYERDPSKFEDMDTDPADKAESNVEHDPEISSLEAVRRCQRPFWICQSKVRPLPKEAFEKGSMQLSKKEKAKLQAEEDAHTVGAEKESVGLSENGKINVEHVKSKKATNKQPQVEEQIEVPKEGVVCG